MKRQLGLLLVMLSLALATGCASGGHVDGSYPRGQIRLTVLDDQGQPIPGAEVRILQADKATPAVGTPIEEHTSARPLVAAGNGLIVCHVTPLTHFSRGRTRRLLEILPVDRVGVAHHFYRTSADGYHPKAYPLPRLFRNKTDLTITHRFRDQVYELPVYASTVTLDRRK